MLENPDGAVRDVIFPVADETVCENLVKKHSAGGTDHDRQVHTMVRASYASHYRRMLPKFLDALEFRSNNATHRPLLEVIEAIKRDRESAGQYYPLADIGVAGVIRPKWRGVVIEEAPDGGQRVNRINYEICVLQSLRDRLRCKEIWVVGAARFRNPDQDLPGDFLERREACYDRLGLPLEANAGLKRLSGGRHGVSYKELLHTQRRYIDKDSLREAIRRVVDATLAARRVEVWGEGTSACAVDSKKFAAWDQNLMTERHNRYGGRGVMIYWHVERKSVCIYSRLKRCSSSEVAAMIEGVLHHDTEMEVERQYVDSHGQSEVAFAFCRMLGFALLPRLKAIASQRLYLPAPKAGEAYPNLTTILTRLIDWELIRTQYDEMVRYATALQERTADPESILRRFTRSSVQHPTYRALAELGKAAKTAFLCRYLRSETLRREIHEGLNVVENWNSSNSFIFFGKGGEVATNRLDDQEASVLSLHLLQSCLVYINTLMLQRVLDKPSWQSRMTEADRRGLCPLVYAHISPYGTFELDLEQRIDLEMAVAA